MGACDRSPVVCRAGVGRDRAAGSGGTAGKASGATLGRCGEAEKMGIDGKGLRNLYCKKFII